MIGQVELIMLNNHMFKYRRENYFYDDGLAQYLSVSSERDILTKLCITLIQKYLLTHSTDFFTGIELKILGECT